jgi:hypothetical protein
MFFYKDNLLFCLLQSHRAACPPSRHYRCAKGLRENNNVEKAGHARKMIHDYLPKMAVLPNPANADLLLICLGRSLSCKIRFLI